VNVGSAETRPLGTGPPAVEVVSAWRRGRSSVSVGKPRTRLEMIQAVAKAPSWRSKQASRGMSWICMDAISLSRCCFASRANLPNRANQAVNGKPVAFNEARRVWGEGWGNTPVESQEGAPCLYSTQWRDGETHWSKGQKVRPVPTITNTPVERLEGAPCSYST
jgi:hypothetical protein